MSELEVRIEQLSAMRMAGFLAYGREPEMAAWNKLLAWAKPRGFLDDLQHHRIFGFNNPNPSVGSPNYGYEFWMVVDDDVEADGEVQVQEFPERLYAVTRCSGVQHITETWHSLAAWRENSSYKSAQHQWLEEHLGPIDKSPEEWAFDLYLPIAR